MAFGGKQLYNSVSNLLKMNGPTYFEKYIKFWLLDSNEYFYPKIPQALRRRNLFSFPLFED